MLAYAYTSLRTSSFERLGLADLPTEPDLYAAIICQLLRSQILQGLHRAYITQTTETDTLRGRLDFSESLARASFPRGQAVCTFEAITVDNQLNQAIKATLLYLHTLPLIKENSLLVKEQLRHFEQISTVPLRSISWSSLRRHQFSRQTQRYRLLVDLCELVAKAALLDQGSDGRRQTSFMDDAQQSLLFERFVREYVRRHYPALTVSASEIGWAEDLEFEGREGTLPRMRSDVMISDKQTTLIIDTKFYGSPLTGRFGTQSLRSGHIYQIQSYVLNYQALHPNRHVSGMLLYAQTEAPIQPVGRFRIHGHDLSVHSINLDRDFAEIAASLDSIVNTSFPDAAAVGQAWRDR